MKTKWTLASTMGVLVVCASFALTTFAQAQTLTPAEKRKQDEEYWNNWILEQLFGAVEDDCAEFDDCFADSGDNQDQREFADGNDNEGNVSSAGADR